MKLRNKKTGKIGYLQNDTVVKRLRVVNANNDTVGEYTSLAELNKEWEDYEEPKEYWYISEQSAIVKMLNNPKDIPNFVEGCLSIGNLFETKEEAEKAVKKLKAWKRLKDAGFEFKGWKVLDHDSPRIYFNVYRKNSDDIVPSLDLLFGGEE